jgi:hypothetical protein
MAQIRHSSPIIISDDDADSLTESDSTIESEPDWWGPENQLGLESGELSRYRQDDDEVTLDERGEIKHNEVIMKY